MSSLASNWQKFLIEELVSVQHPGPRSRSHKRNSVCSGFRHDLYLTPQMNFSSLLPCSRPHLVIGCIKIIPYNKNPSIPGVAVRWLLCRDSGSAAAICHGAPALARPQSAARSTTSNWPLRNLYSLSYCFNLCDEITPKVKVLIVACARINHQYSPSHLCFSVSDSHIFHQYI